MPARRTERSAKMKKAPGRLVVVVADVGFELDGPSASDVGLCIGEVLLCSRWRTLGAKNRLLGLGGASDLGCCGMFAMSGSSAQKNGEATLVPSRSREISRFPSSEMVM